MFSFNIVDAGAAHPLTAAFQPFSIGIKRQNAPPVLHLRRHHKRLAASTGAHINHLHAWPCVTQQRRNLRSLILILKKPLLPFRQILGAGAFFQPNANGRERVEMTFETTAGKFFPQHAPVTKFYRVDPDIGCRLALQRQQFGLGRLTKRGNSICHQKIRPFKRHITRHVRVIQLSFGQLSNKLQLIGTQCRRIMLALAAEQCRDFRWQLPVNQHLGGDRDAAGRDLASTLLQMPEQARPGPMHLPEHGRDRLPVSRACIASPLQSPAQPIAGEDGSPPSRR
jgi:hypothetical protein